MQLAWPSELRALEIQWISGYSSLGNVEYHTLHIKVLSLASGWTGGLPPPDSTPGENTCQSKIHFAWFFRFFPFLPHLCLQGYPLATFSFLPSRLCFQYFFPWKLLGPFSARAFLLFRQARLLVYPLFHRHFFFAFCSSRSLHAWASYVAACAFVPVAWASYVAACALVPVAALSVGVPGRRFTFIKQTPSPTQPYESTLSLLPYHRYPLLSQFTSISCF